MGRLIRHASGCVTLPVHPLAITMVLPAFRTALVTAVSCPTLLPAGVDAAGLAAIALPPIAAGTDPEHRMASLTAAHPLPKNHFFQNRHPPTQADFDNGNGPCQGRTSFEAAFS